MYKCTIEPHPGVDDDDDDLHHDDDDDDEDDDDDKVQPRKERSGPPSRAWTGQIRLGACGEDIPMGAACNRYYRHPHHHPHHHQDLDYENGWVCDCSG